MSTKLLSRHISTNLMFLLILTTALTGCGGSADSRLDTLEAALKETNSEETTSSHSSTSITSVTSSTSSLITSTLSTAKSSLSNSSLSPKSVDTVAPTVPATIKKILVTNGKVELSWSAATDNIAVTTYKVLRNQTLIATLDAKTLSYTDTTVAPNTTYTYSVKAGDAAGLWSSTKSFSTKTLSIISIPTSSVSSANRSVSSVSNSGPAASSASSSVKSTAIAGSAMFKWTIPNQRENDSPLYTTEIGGYEIRYKLKSASTFTSITIADGFTSAYTIPNLSGDYDFQIAAYDINQLYSQFVAIYPI